MPCYVYIIIFLGIICWQISFGDIFKGAPAADAIVSPANSFGFMDGGIDMVGEDDSFLSCLCRCSLFQALNWW